MVNQSMRVCLGPRFLPKLDDRATLKRSEQKVRRLQPRPMYAERHTIRGLAGATLSKTEFVRDHFLENVTKLIIV